MGTDYSPTAPSRIELFARVLIACRDHSLPVPASLSVHSADGASMFVDTEYEANEWGSFLGTRGIKRDFYGWNLHLMVRSLDFAVVDDAVADFETRVQDLVYAGGQCAVPYIRDNGGGLTDIELCVRPKGHLGDHADGARQWKNDYNDTDAKCPCIYEMGQWHYKPGCPVHPSYRTVTP